MPIATKAPNGAFFFAMVLGLLILLLWTVQLATLTDLGDSDAAGNGLAEAFAGMEIVLLWTLLAVLLVVAGMNGAMPWQAVAAAVILLPASGFAAITALELLVDHTTAPFRWPIMAPAGVPPIVVMFASWTLLPSLRAAIPARLAGGVAWGATLLLCIGMWPMAQIRDRAVEQAQAAYARWEVEFARMPPDAPLWDWTAFLNTPNETRVEAVLDRIRKLDHRQAEAEVMLDRGDFPLRYLGEFNLAPTPSVCEKARGLLRRRVAPLVLQSPGSRPYTDIALEVEGALAAMNWLVIYGCACDAESLAWESMSKNYRDTNFDVYELAELREPAALGRNLQPKP